MNRSLELGMTNLDCMASVLSALAETDPDLLLVTSDSRGSGKVTGFAQKFKDQVVEVGIAEQDSVGISAGLASCGKKVFTISPGSFLSARALEQVKNDVAYSKNPVALIGISSGASYGGLGATHHSLHDLAVLMAIPGIDLIVPADNAETEAAIRSYAENPRPVYIRFGKKVMPKIHSSAAEIQIGKASVLSEGNDLLIVATGEPLWPAYEAAIELRDQGIRCGLISMHTLNPFDTQTVLEMAAAAKAIVTVEEHSVNGGLGAFTAALLMQNRIFKPMKIIAFPHEELVTGSQTELFNHYGISASGIQCAALELLKQRRIS